MEPASIVSAILNAGKGLIAAGKWSDKGSFDDHLIKTIEQNDREVLQLAYALARSIIAHALGASFTDERVDEFLAGLGDDPRFAARLHRLLGEARKSPRERRKMLVAALLAIPLTGVPVNDQDRLDMLFERMLPDEIDLLQKIAVCQGIRPRHPEASLFTFKFSGAWARYLGEGLEIGPGDSLSDHVVGPNDPQAEPFIANTFAFSSLGTLALIEVRDPNHDFAVSPHAHFAELQQLTITPLGRLVLRALEDEHMQVGLNAPD